MFIASSALLKLCLKMTYIQSIFFYIYIIYKEATLAIYYGSHKHFNIEFTLNVWKYILGQYQLIRVPAYCRISMKMYAYHLHIYYKPDKKTLQCAGPLNSKHLIGSQLRFPWIRTSHSYKNKYSQVLNLFQRFENLLSKPKY